MSERSQALVTWYSKHARSFLEEFYPERIEEFDREQMGYRRAQVLECNVRRSAFDNVTKIVGWTDGGYYIELIDGADFIGHRAKVCLQDIRRSYAVADVILPGVPVGSRSLA